MSKVIKAKKVESGQVQELAIPESLIPDSAGDEPVWPDEFSMLTAFVAQEGPSAGEPGSPASEAEGAQPRDPLEQAREELEALKAQASRILAEAREKAQQIEGEAYEQGYSQGRKDGEELGKKEYEATARRAEAVLDAIETRGLDLLGRYEAALVELALEAASKVVQARLETDRTVVMEALRAGMEQAVEGSEIKIRLNPSDLELVAEFMHRDPALTKGHRVDLVPDGSVKQGGCLIETDFGLIDATVDARWEAVKGAVSRIIEERLGSGQGEV